MTLRSSLLPLLSASSSRSARLAALLLATLPLLSGHGLDPAHARAGQTNAIRNPDDVVLNFVEADLDAVVRALGYFTGTNFLLDPRVKGQLTLVSEQPVNRDVAHRMLLGALRMQGFAVVEAGGVSKVVPEADAKLQGGAVAGVGGTPAAFGGDQLVTRVFTLKYENAANLVPVLRPMIAPNNPINAYPGNNTLVVTDYATNLNRIAQVIQSIDTPTSTDTAVVPVQYGVAADMASQVTRLLDTGNADPTQRIAVVADTRSNSLMIRSGSPARTRLARDLIAQMDTPEAGQSNMHVVTLRNAEATRLAEVLRGVLTGQPASTRDDTGGLSNSGGQAGSMAGGMGAGMNGAMGNTAMPTGAGSMAAQPGGTGSYGAGGMTAGSTAFSGGGATIQADPATNTLIIMAPTPIYRNLRTIIDQLDVRRPQVFVESLIVEISSSQAAEFGIQWMAGMGNIGRDGTVAVGGTNFGSGGDNLLKVAAKPIGMETGLNLGVIKGSVRLPGVGEILNLGFLARALQSSGNANILSTPNLLTLNNEEARIMVGRNLPFVTGQYTQTGADGINPFQTIERQDVGLQLRIRPQVSEGGTIKMAIHQEVSNVDAAMTAAMPDLGVATNKREINTNVLVDDGQIIVLGGLLEDSVSGGREQVPGLGDIPLVGNLFRYDTRSRTKTNLMVFLRPYVVRGADANRLTAERYDVMRAMQGTNMPTDHWLLPQLGTPTLPPRIPGAGDELPVGASQTTPDKAMVVARDPAAFYIDRGVNVLLAATLPSSELAEQAMQQIRGAGLAPYSRPHDGDNPSHLVYIRVARDAITTDMAIGTLRQLGFAPELLVRP